MDLSMNLLNLLLWTLIWALGGYLILVSLFKLQQHEATLLGFGLGLVLQAWVSNLLGHFFAPVPAFWAAAGTVLLIGMLLTTLLKSWKSAREQFTFPIGYWVAFVLLLYIFFMIGHGLAIFDDYQNLPTTSFLAVGSIPPVFPLNPKLSFDYHYLMLLIAAQSMRLGGIFPWVALDLTRAVFFSLAMIYVFFLGKRLTRSLIGGWFTALFTAFAGGLRWLLLFLPGRALAVISDQINMIGSGIATDPSLKLAFSKPWAIEGGGPLPFLFAYGNGFHTVSVMEHGGTGMMGLTIALLLILTFKRWKHPAGMAVIGALLAAQALVDEIWFGYFLAAFVIIALIHLIRQKDQPHREIWLGLVFFVVIPALFALFQGGVLTGTAKQLLNLGSKAGSESYFSNAFYLRWPPAIISSHLGELSLLNPAQLLVALLEVGPIFLLLPLMFAWGKKGWRSNQVIYAILAVMVAISLFSVFVGYRGDAGISATKRLSLVGTELLTVFAVPLLWYWLRHRPLNLKLIVVGMMLLCCVGGIVYFAIETTAMQVPQESYFLDDLDAKVESQYWDKLEEDAMVFDLIPSRAATVFARPLASNNTWYETTADYSRLASSLDPYALHAAGYDYLYLGAGEWDDFSETVQERLSAPCVQLHYEVTGARGDFRRLLDLRGCQ
ncbi:MAG TPA: hypothetical protein PLX92_05785 [Anaerolineaceae bacterium]|nr:hypothetical protein [Anaerolineaceae bacterium]HUM49700.1 hypothetical protein [Anaerolineaceae bacterium]